MNAATRGLVIGGYSITAIWATFALIAILHADAAGAGAFLIVSGVVLAITERIPDMVAWSQRTGARR